MGSVFHAQPDGSFDVVTSSLSLARLMVEVFAPGYEDWRESIPLQRGERLPNRNISMRRMKDAAWVDVLVTYEEEPVSGAVVSLHVTTDELGSGPTDRKVTAVDGRARLVATAAAALDGGFSVASTAELGDGRWASAAHRSLLPEEVGAGPLGLALEKDRALLLEARDLPPSSTCPKARVRIAELHGLPHVSARSFTLLDAGDGRRCRGTLSIPRGASGSIALIGSDGRLMSGCDVLPLPSEEAEEIEFVYPGVGTVLVDCRSARGLAADEAQLVVLMPSMEAENARLSPLVQGWAHFEDVPHGAYRALLIDEPTKSARSAGIRGAADLDHRGEETRLSVR